MDAVQTGKYFYCRNNDFSEIQIQKLTYYAYAWNLALYNEKLFEEKPQAWIHGPVFRTLYDAMRYSDFYNTNTLNMQIENKTLRILDMIYNLYGKYSGNELEQMTHSESPWKKARTGLDANMRSMRELDDEEIKRYYKALLT